MSYVHHVGLIIVKGKGLLRIKKSALPVLLACVSISTSALATVRLPTVISDDMVLQQGQKDPIWGWADPGEKVTVAINGQKVSATADREGRWLVRLSAMKAGGPYDMTVTGDNDITRNSVISSVTIPGPSVIKLSNILVGEVWICSGQSNMEWPVAASNNAQQEIAGATFPQIRLLTVEKATAGFPQTEMKGRWVMCTPRTVGDFSAVGYFFGRKLHRDLNVPVGLIDSSWGGTPAESWTPTSYLEANTDFHPILSRWESSAKLYPQQLKDYEKLLADWTTASTQPQDRGMPLPAKPNPPTDPFNNPWRPATLYNAMIAPIVPYGIRGAIWYQGESNADRAYQYRSLFATMIKSWRDKWGKGDFPFLFVQLANFAPGGNNWPELREAQTKTLDLPNTGMAVITDIGDPNDIHPRNKQDVGHRLALAAEANTYGRKISYSGPMYRSMRVEGSKVRLRFNHANNGLKTTGGTMLKGFTIAGEDKEFKPAEARIEGGTVVVWSDQVSSPKSVRYNWSGNPEGNLYNGADLPANSFRTDDWPGLTDWRK